jgi:small GTP-binding protein
MIESNNKNFTDVSLDQSTYAIVRQKLVVVGDVSVGKTAIISSLLGQKFKESYEASVGVDFFSKTLKFKNKNLKLQIWDSAGQEKYKSLIPSYIRGSAIIFVIYDITSN